MRVVSRPERPKNTEPRPPSRIRGWWLPVGTVVEHNGHLWKKTWHGAADQEWHQWDLVGPAPKPNAEWTRRR